MAQFLRLIAARNALYKARY